MARSIYICFQARIEYKKGTQISEPKVGRDLRIIEEEESPLRVRFDACIYLVTRSKLESLKENPLAVYYTYGS